MTDLLTRLRTNVLHEPWQIAKEAADEIERLQKELAECRKDAERYRWLRSNAHSMDVVQWMMGDHGWQINILGDYATVDAAIDAAMKQEEV